jgi:chemotaxis protein MotA
MDKSTIFGLVGSCLLMLGAILYGSPLQIFWDTPSAIIVVGGCITALFIGFPTTQVIAGLKAAKITFKPRTFTAKDTIKLLLDLATKARSEGLLALESAAEGIDDKFLKKGLQLMADGHDSDTLESVLFGELDKMDERHKKNAEIWDAIAAYGPAMGMIGTLIGLVQMLQNMSDPASIGPAMAVALLTTFYGSFIANIMGIPLANKMKIRNKEEVAHMEMVVTGLKSILAGENPRFLVDRLNSTIAPKLRYEEAA